MPTAPTPASRSSWSCPTGPQPTHRSRLQPTRRRGTRHRRGSYPVPMPARPLPGHGPGPQPIGKALDVVMRSLGAPEASGVHLVFDRWAAVVGEALAARTKPLKIEGKRLVLAVDEPAIATPAKDRQTGAVGKKVAVRD